MGYILIPFGIWLIISFITYETEYKNRVSDIYNEPRTKTNWNAIALLINVYELIINYDWKDKFKPKSPLDKEIAETEKEISELEAQKVKMDKLKELERRKERLFKEVKDNTDEVDSAEYHCYTCDKIIIGLDNFYAHRRKNHTS